MGNSHTRIIAVVAFVGWMLASGAQLWGQETSSVYVSRVPNATGLPGLDAAADAATTTLELTMAFLERFELVTDGDLPSEVAERIPLDSEGCRVPRRNAPFIAPAAFRETGLSRCSEQIPGLQKCLFVDANMGQGR